MNIKTLSLGAGVQSTALLHMALDGEIERPDVVMFADTGWEPAATYQNVWMLAERCEREGMPFYIVSAGSIRENTLNAINNRTRFCGPPYFSATGSPGRRQCTREFKIEPLTRQTRELMGYSKGQHVKDDTAEVWMGISWDERHRVSMAKVKWQINVYPLVEQRITRSMCVDWLIEHGHCVPAKSACIGCPYRSDREWHDMKVNRPEEFADAVEVDRVIRQKLPGMNNESYIHRSLKPLGEIDFGINDSQLTMFEEDTAAPNCGLCDT